MKKILLIALMSLGQIVFSQKGTIKGTITDKGNNQELPFANVFIKGTTIGGTTEMDGTFTIKAPVGKKTLVFSFVGYKTAEKEVIIEKGKTTTVNHLMEPQGQLDEVKIVVETSKEKETVLLKDQKEATIIKESIGAVELSKKGVSDAAAATTKVSGVAKQEGSSNVFVRGLGDRYNSTTLNGLPLPSNNPSNKNIALDLFSTSVIQSVGVSKSFDPSLSGDVAGANIDVKSKEFSGKPYLNLGIGFGGNSQTTAQKFKTIDGANWFGVADHTKHKVTDLKTLPFKDNFATNKDRVAPLNSSLSISGGKRFRFEDESSLSVFLVGAFSNNYRFSEGFSINIKNKKTDTNGNITGFSFNGDYPDTKEYKYSNNKLTMGNFVYKINPDNRISLNSLFIHSNSQKIEEYTGKAPDIAEDDEIANIILQTQNQNKLLVNQLLSEHKLGQSFDLNLGLSYNLINNDEPNRKRNIFTTNNTNNKTELVSGTPGYNSRYYQNLKERDVNAMFSLVKYLGNRDENKGALKVGYSFRNTNRDFETTLFDYDISTTAYVDVVGDPDSVLNQEGSDSGIFDLETANGTSSSDEALIPFTYTGTKTTHSPFALVDYNLTDDFFISAGVRYEKVDMGIEYYTNQKTSNGIPKKVKNDYILPSFNLKYSFTDDNLLRFSGSKTYTYPQFKEVAPFVYEGVNHQESGNENLKASENYNVDLKWEMYPEKDELISATVFGKIINNAINRIEINAASSNVYSYLNTGDSKVYGAEIELKKNLVTLNEDNNEKLKIGFNATYMYNLQKFNKSGTFNPTNDEDPLEGAAPLLINADLTYARKINKKETSASIIFNYQDKKLYSVGSVNMLKGVYQKSIPALDFVLKQKFTSRLGAKLSVKNILDPKIERYRNLPTSPVMRSYKNGINCSLGFNYKL